MRRALEAEIEVYLPPVLANSVLLFVGYEMRDVKCDRVGCGGALETYNSGFSSYYNYNPRTDAFISMSDPAHTAFPCVLVCDKCAAVYATCAQCSANPDSPCRCEIKADGRCVENGPATDCSGFVTNLGAFPIVLMRFIGINRIASPASCICNEKCNGLPMRVTWFPHHMRCRGIRYDEVRETWTPNDTRCTNISHWACRECDEVFDYRIFSAQDDIPRVASGE